MVGMVVAGSGYLDEIEPLRRDHSFGHPDMRFVGSRILVYERVRQIRVEQEEMVLPMDEETALTEPPEMEMFGVLARGGDVGEEGVVLEGRLNHVSSETKFLSHLFHA